MATTDKPRLVFFPYEVSQTLPDFILMHRREHLKCLSAFFYITVIDEDCNYDEICDTHCPDLALFETGLNLPNSRRLSIVNTNTHIAIPKVAFINADAWCETRSGTLSEIDQWGIETLFSISTTVTEHLPGIAADRLFTWPPFIDTDTYRDYGEPKLIPIVLTGSQDPQYPWRRGVYKQLTDNYPSLVCPHGGYLRRSRELQVMWGERYAHTLNASLLVPACGTVAKEAVRKHFEIPGCKACLITEASAALTAAGFVDMQNCVFANESNVLDKVEYLFNNPAKLMKITEAGYDLVRSRHTLGHRSQMLQWYKLEKELRPHQRIIQSNPFGSLRVVDSSSHDPTPAVALNGLHLALIRDGDEAIAAGNLDKAKQSYQKSLNYMPRLPEANFKLGLCSLYQGDAKEAEERIWEPIQYSLAEYKAIDPDPIEWAYYIVSLLCRGKLQAARRCAAEFSWLEHSELQRVRCLVKVLANKGATSAPSKRFLARYRTSIHRLPERSMQNWIEELSKMLAACGQNQFVEYMRTAATLEALHTYEEKCGLQSNQRPKTESATQGYKRPLPGSLSKYRWARNIGVRVLSHKVHRKIRNYVLAAIHNVEGRVGFLRPYAISGRRDGYQCRSIETLLGRDSIRAVLIIGAAPRSRITEALLQRNLANQERLSVVCVGDSIDIRTCGCESQSTKVLVSMYSAASEKEQSTNLASILGAILADNQIKQFDAVLIDGSKLAGKEVTANLSRRVINSATLVILTDINTSDTCIAYQELVENDWYSLVEYDLESSGGFAVFKRRNSIEVSRGQKQGVCCPARAD